MTTDHKKRLAELAEYYQGCKEPETARFLRLTIKLLDNWETNPLDYSSAVKRQAVRIALDSMDGT